MTESGSSLATPARVRAPVRAMTLLGAVVFVVSLDYGAGLPLIQPTLGQYLGPDAPQRLAWHVGMLDGVYTFALFGGQTLGLTGSTLAIMFVTCGVAMLAAQSMLLMPAVRRRIDQRWVAATFAASALALSFTAVVSGAGALGLLIAVVATGVGLIGPVLSYELLERDRSEPGARLGNQAAAGNLGQALGLFSAGSLFVLHPAAPFWLAALVLLLGAGAAYALWGAARDDEIALSARPQVTLDATAGAK